MTSGLPWTEKFLSQFSEKEAREEYVADQVRTRIALLVRSLRDQPERQWSQAELGRRAGKLQSAISRIEDPDYGKHSLQTLLEIAAAFDLPLYVDILEWDDWFRRMEDISTLGLHRRGFSLEEIIALARPSATSATNVIPFIRSGAGQTETKGETRSIRVSARETAGFSRAVTQA